MIDTLNVVQSQVFESFLGQSVEKIEQMQISEVMISLRCSWKLG